MFLLDKFDRLRAAWIKETRSILRDSALKFLNYAHNLDLPGGPVENLVGKYFLHDFVMWQNIVVWSQSRHQAHQAIWEQYYDHCVANYLDEVQNLLGQGLNEDLMYNLDETHFIFDQDDSKALGFLGEIAVYYAEVSNGPENFALVPLIRSGSHACIESIFVIFKNENANHPILGIAMIWNMYRTGLVRRVG